MFTSQDDVQARGVPVRTLQEIAATLNDFYAMTEGNILLLHENSLEAAETLELKLNHSSAIIDAAKFDNFTHLAVAIRNTAAKHAGIETIPYPDKPHPDNEHGRHMFYSKAVWILEEAGELLQEQRLVHPSEWYLHLMIINMSDEIANIFKRFRDQFWQIGKTMGIIVIAPPSQRDLLLFQFTDSWCWPHGLYSIK